MAAKKYTKKPMAKKPIMKRSTTKRIPRAPSDGQNLLITSYFEVSNKQAANAGDNNSDTKLSYSIRCDPRDCKLTLSGNAVALHGEGVSVAKADGTQLINTGSSSNDLAFSRFAQFAPLYRQYKINSVKLDVMVDRECGLDNPLMFSTDKADSTPASNIGTLVGAAHKEFTMTESRRLGKYGWKPSSSQDKDYRNMSQELSDNDAHFVKVYQDINAKNNGICKHRVTVTINATLKDSTGTAVALN